MRGAGRGGGPVCAARQVLRRAGIWVVVAGLGRAGKAGVVSVVCGVLRVLTPATPRAHSVFVYGEGRVMTECCGGGSRHLTTDDRCGVCLLCQVLMRR